MEIKKFVLAGLLFLLAPLFSVYAQNAPIPQETQTLEGTIQSVSTIKKSDVLGRMTISQNVDVLITKGSLKDKHVTVNTGLYETASQIQYKKGDNVVVIYTKDDTGHDVFYISDYVRRTPLLMLLGLFILASVFIGRWHGVRSLIGMGLSFGVIFIYVIPTILSGSEPVSTAIGGSIIIIPITFYLSHGLNKKTTIAVFSTLVALLVTGLLAQLVTIASHITGYSSEEASFIQVIQNRTSINMQGLFLAGIIIGVSGILDDITISQTALIQKLKDLNPSEHFWNLYKHGMDVGRDHIASLINTLILVYAGASLPLLILFVNSPHPLSEVVNYELIASEIIRTLVSSIGIIIAVPISTYLSCLVLTYKKKK